MRSKISHTLSDREVQAFAQQRLSQPLNLKANGWKFNAQLIWKVVILAALKSICYYAWYWNIARADSAGSAKLEFVEHRGHCHV